MQTQFTYHTNSERNQAKALAETEKRWAEHAYAQRHEVVEFDDYNDYSVRGRFIVRPVR